MTDYPDYTTLMQIIGSDIMVPIDVQGAYIMMPIDIQAQYVTLDIDIVAQTVGNIAIDIKAQTVGNIAVSIAAAVTLNVNISSITGGVTFNIGTITGTVNVNLSAQTISNIDIDFEAQSVGIYLQPEWASKTGIDKTIRATGTNIAFGDYAYTDYVVTAGKTLYITSFQGSAYTTVAEDADKQQTVEGYLANQTDSLYFGYCGGNGGFSITFSTPVAIPSGKTFRLRVANRANHNSSLRGSITGYEA